MSVRKFMVWMLLLCAMVVALPTCSSAQVNTVNLSGTVLDPQNLAVQDAKLTLQNPAKGIERTASSDANGRYEFVGLPPGTYTLAVDAPGFAIWTDTSFTLTLGQVAEYNPQLQLKTTAASVSVSAAPDLVETSKTDVSMTVSQNQIDNLPINGRNYINFTLLDSRAARDNTPSIGAAPNTGLNLGGQRGRSNEISVDGADAVDSSVNGVRATVSQEGVQEFQVISSSYMPEYGRAMGGVVNIVTKSGSNEIHGNAFGFLRNGAIQAQNPFSVTASCNPTTFECGITPVKQSYTRVQTGLTLGGPIQKDKTFFFFSYELTRREETGFTAIGQDNFGFINSHILPPNAGPCPLRDLRGFPIFARRRRVRSRLSLATHRFIQVQHFPAPARRCPRPLPGLFRQSEISPFPKRAVSTPCVLITLGIRGTTLSCARWFRRTAWTASR
jgi:hypothetical protein